MKPRVLVTRKLLPQALAWLGKRVDVEIGTLKDALPRARLLAAVADKDGLLSLLVDSIDREVMDAAPRLKIVANCAVGYNNVDIAYARARGILVTNTPGVLTEATADLAWALILAVARRIPQAEAFLRRGEFKGWAIDLCLGKDLSGKRLGIIGMGRIGRAVAERAKAFRMETVYCDTAPLSPAEETRLAARRLTLEDLLASSDVVSVHAVLTPETHHLISAARLRLMKPQSILVNVSRGPIVDEAALVSALAEGRLWGAGLDVYEREPAVTPGLLDLPNVVCLPHIGSATYETRLAMCMMAVRNLVQGLSGERPGNLIPELEDLFPTKPA